MHFKVICRIVNTFNEENTYGHICQYANYLPNMNVVKLLTLTIYRTAILNFFRDWSD